jgi:vancomycin resistance protein YoaR
MASVDSAIDEMSGKASLKGDVVDPDVTTAEAETAAKKARVALSEQLVLKAEGKSWTISPADLGSAMDVTKQDGKIDVGLNSDRLDGILTNVYNDLTVKPVEASYGFDANGNVIVKPSHDGRTVQGDKLLDAIQGGIFEGKREYQVQTTVDKPRYTTAGLESKKPTQLLGTYKTDYTLSTDKSDERITNLNVASKEVSGTFVAPGEIYSMNETVSDANYEVSHVIIEGEARTPHDSQLPYIRPGMDATIWFGGADMQFKNTTDGYVLLEEYVAGDYVYANVYGVPQDVNVEMSSNPVWMTKDGSEWVTHYKRWEDGKLVYKDQWNTKYDALYDEKGKKIPTDIVYVSPVNGGSG